MTAAQVAAAAATEDRTTAALGISDAPWGRFFAPPLAVNYCEIMVSGISAGFGRPFFATASHPPERSKTCLSEEIYVKKTIEVVSDQFSQTTGNL
jgi:hypothetical protein